MKQITIVFKTTNLVLLALCGFSQVATAANIDGDYNAGQEKSAVCAGCHNPDGNSAVGINPIIAGQHADYLYMSLQSYKNGERKNAIMNSIAAGLSDEDMRNLAVYFAAQDSKLNTVPADKLD